MLSVTLYGITTILLSTTIYKTYKPLLSMAGTIILHVQYMIKFYHILDNLQHYHLVYCGLLLCTPNHRTFLFAF